MITTAAAEKFVGALLVVAISLGYMATDKLIANIFLSKEPATAQEL